MRFGRTITTMAALALGLGLTAGATTALGARKNCRRLCRDEIRACLTTAHAAHDCAGLRGGDRHDCKVALRAAVRDCRANKGSIIQRCKASAETATCGSPSGAFVDGPVNRAAVASL